MSMEHRYKHDGTATSGRTQQRDILPRECPGMGDLVSWLDTIDRRPGLNELEARLKSSEFNLKALRRH